MKMLLRLGSVIVFSFFISLKITGQTVYICTGSYAYAFHSYSECPGLNACSAQIYSTTQYSAVYTYGRKPCCICWSPKPLDCAYDGNSNYGGGGGGSSGDSGEGLAYAAIGIAAAVVTVGTFLVSNEFTLYPIMSFQPHKYMERPNLNVKLPSGGMRFNFKKNFTPKGNYIGDFEYGFEMLRIRTEYSWNNYGYYNNYNSQSKSWEYVIYAGYVHHLSIFPRTDKLKLVLGPVMKFNFNHNQLFGFGGMAGICYLLHERVKIDAKYELTNNSNQIFGGLSFVYQKEYFWKKRRNR